MKKLSIKEKEFCRNLIETKNQTEAALRSYNVKDRVNAGLLGYQLMKKPKIQNEINRLLEERDVTDDLLMNRLREGLDANVVSNYKGEANQTEIPDMDTRFKYFEAGAKIKQLFPPERVETKSLNIDLQLENMSKAELSDILTKLLQDVNEQGGKEVPAGKDAGRFGEGNLNSGS